MFLNEKNLEKNVVDETSKKDLDTSLPKDWRYASSHPKELIIGDTRQGIKIRSSLRHINNLAFISQIEPKNIKEGESDPTWINAKQEKLNQFKRINVWTLVERALDNNVIRTKWVFRHKLNENGIVVRNKARLVA